MSKDFKKIDQYRIFDAELSDLMENSEPQLTKSQALLEIFKPALVENGEIEDILPLVHEDTSGRNRVKFDGIFFNEGMLRVDLFVTLLVEEDGLEISDSLIEPTIQKAGRAFRLALNRDFKRFSGETLAEMENIATKQAQFQTGRIILLTNGFFRKEQDYQDNQMNDGFSVSIRTFDLKRYFRINQQAGSLKDIVIDFEKYLGNPLPCIEEKNINKDYDTYLALMSGDLIFDLFEDYGTKLYEYNVRSFLQARGKVNKGIQTTILNNPDKFLAYNNGLVATAEEIEIITIHQTPYIKKIRGLQIVNGAQTTASIHRAKKLNKADLSNISVAAKITHIRNDSESDFVSNISLYANSQNNIQIADLSANDPFHIEIERLATTTWCPGEQERWFYERTRGSYQLEQFSAGTTPSKQKAFKKECPPAKVFKKTDIATANHAWQQLPHIVSFGAQKNFNAFMQGLAEYRTDDWKPDVQYYKNLIAQIIIFKATSKIVDAKRRAKLIPAYGANIKAYTVAYISYIAETNLNYELIWQEQSLSNEFLKAIEALCIEISEVFRKAAGSSNPSEYAKKEACWNDIKESGVVVNLSEVPEFQSDEPYPAIPSTEDESNWVEWCKALSTDSLAAMLFYGQTSGRLGEYEARVLATVFGYARGNWYRSPTHKQAKFIRSAYSICIADGLEL